MTGSAVVRGMVLYRYYNQDYPNFKNFPKITFSEFYFTLYIFTKLSRPSATRIFYELRDLGIIRKKGEYLIFDSEKIAYWEKFLSQEEKANIEDWHNEVKEANKETEKKTKGK